MVFSHVKFAFGHFRQNVFGNESLAVVFLSCSDIGSEEESTLHNVLFGDTSEEKRHVLKMIMFVYEIYEKEKFILAINSKASI